MVTIKAISKTFGEPKVLDAVTLSIGREVVGLVGANGAGKSTLLKIITGEIVPDSGTVHKHGEIIGYLPQNPECNGQTVHEVLSAVINSTDEYKIDSVLAQVGLLVAAKEKNPSTLSGGEKTKLFLARLLLQEPTLLLLDEPTNNLDIDAVEWLEDIVKNFDGAVVLSSHDRAFLDNVTTKIVELDKGKTTSFGGNYTFYKEQKEAYRQTALDHYKEETKEVKKIERALKEKQRQIVDLTKKKEPKDTNKMGRDFLQEKATRKAISQQKNLEKRLENTDEQKPEERIQYPFSFIGDVHTSKFVIGAKQVCKSFGPHTVLHDISLIIHGQERVWLNGKNGSGKSTFLQILAGKIEADSGEIEIGEHVKVGYFSQELKMTNGAHSVLEELQLLGASATEAFKYGIYMHLTPEEMKKKQSELSRGQQTKLEFIKLLMQQNNLLILDEPTNHLEIETREQIEKALHDYQGAILIASHDRYFIKQIGITRAFNMKS